MQIDVLFFEGCPHYEPAVELIRDVADELGLDPALTQIEIRTPEDVARFAFLGSPTIRVNGEDIEADRRGDANYAMSCRRYGEAGTPPRQLLVTALTNGAMS
jgi:hypothetical protein